MRNVSTWFRYARRQIWGRRRVKEYRIYRHYPAVLMSFNTTDPFFRKAKPILPLFMNSDWLMGDC